MSRKTKSIVKSVFICLALLLLALAVTAALTNGFKTSNPYGWLENFDRMKKGQEIAGFEVCKDFDVDFEKLVNNVEAVEDKEAGTKTYALLKTDNVNIYINVVETIADKKSSYVLNVNGQSICTSADGFNDTAIEAIKSFDICKITDVKNAGRLAHYVGAIKPVTTTETSAKYEVMKVGQTISGFEWNFDNGVDVQELIKGIEPAAGDGGNIYYLVKTDSESISISVQTLTREGNTIYGVSLGQGCPWASDSSLIDSDLDSCKSFTACKITEVHNAEVLAKYVGAKA